MVDGTIEEKRKGKHSSLFGLGGFCIGVLSTIALDFLSGSIVRRMNKNTAPGYVSLNDVFLYSKDLDNLKGYETILRVKNREFLVRYSDPNDETSTPTLIHYHVDVTPFRAESRRIVPHE
jgi:hypothetical protein